ncbi:MAG: cupin domain-containing protein [Chloroflexi bacterium]|nr:cupin domain-containing protein [Chloroflexota bacterium]MBI5956521.1 cupin domain-containing protein [Chloroflexota bacterium]
MAFFKGADLPSKIAGEGISRQAVYLDQVMMTFFHFAPGAIVPEHSHPHEQITTVTEGVLEFNLDGQVALLSAGDGVAVPANLRHSARALDIPTKAIDAWHPVREDYK